MRRLLSLVTFSLGLQLLCIWPIFAAQPFFVPKGTLIYDVVRDGEVIGAQKVDFHNSGDELTVNMASEITVTLLGIPVYRFDQKSEEVWKSGSMISYRADVKDGDQEKKLLMHRNGNELVGTYNGKNRVAPGGILTSLLWRKDAVDATNILDAINGKVKATKAEKIGEEFVKIGDRDVKATHYRFTGDFKRDAWYDEDGYMVMAILIARDGSKVTQILRALP